MKRLRLILLLLVMLVQGAAAQVFQYRPPLYIVNGVRMSEAEVKSIAPADIVSNRLLPPDEQSIEKYGPEAANGVIEIVLRYDTPARFEPDGKTQRYADYVASRIKWEYPSNPVARVVVKLHISAEGKPSVSEVIDATDKRLMKRVSGVVESSPLWTPAMKQGQGVEFYYTLRLTLPQGMELPRERSIPIIVGGV